MQVVKTFQSIINAAARLLYAHTDNQTTEPFVLNLMLFKSSLLDTRRRCEFYDYLR